MQSSEVGLFSRENCRSPFNSKVRYNICLPVILNFYTVYIKIAIKKLIILKLYFFITGRILNRFSKDMGALDELLPRFLLESIQIYLVMFSILALNAAALVWTLLPTTIILSLFYTILQIYLKSAQSIKRLEGTSTCIQFHINYIL